MATDKKTKLPKENKNIGEKIRKYAFNFWGNFHKKYWDFIESLPGKAASLASNTWKAIWEVAWGIEDLGWVAAQTLKTAGPKILDSANDSIYKPIKRNAQWLLWMEVDTWENTIDKIATMARFNDRDTFKNHKFNTDLIQDNAENIQSWIEFWAGMVWLWKLKFAKNVFNPKWFTFLSKDRKYKKGMDSLKSLRKKHADALKGWTKFTEKQEALYKKEILKLEESMNKHLSKASVKYNKTKDGKINKVEWEQSKLHPDLNKIVNPSKGNIITRNPKKSIAAASLIGAWLIGINKGWSIGEWDDALTEELWDEPITDSNAWDETVDNETNWNENNSGTSIVTADDGSSINEEKDLTDSVNNDDTSAPTDGLLAGETKDKKGVSYKLYYKNGVIMWIWSNGKTVQLMDWVTNANKKYKVQDAANKLLSL